MSVDDVFYTGESLFRADFVGRHLEVGPGWIVDCAVPPYEETLGITIRAASRN